jgi:hypothetical protein
MNEHLLSAIAYSFGALLIPFVAMRLLARRHIAPGLTTTGLLVSFSLAWSCQLLVVLSVGESPFLTVPSALLLACVSMVHIATIGGSTLYRVAVAGDSPTPATWQSFYSRLLCLYLPTVLVLSSAFGIAAAMLGAPQYSAAAGTIAQLPASAYAAYFSFKWLARSRREA